MGRRRRTQSAAAAPAGGRQTQPRERTCRALRCGLACALALALGGCSFARDPVPSAAFDGRYVGARLSAPADACGPVAPRAAVVATVRGGALTLRLFGPGTEVAGTVGAGGTLRASGIWRTDGGFPFVTVLHGHIDDGTLSGTASNLGCVTLLTLHRARHRLDRAGQPRSFPMASR